MLESSVELIEKAIAWNSLCDGGLLVQNRVFGVPRGPSGGPEILALLYADAPHMRYWFGHVLRHPDKPDRFVSLIVWSEHLVNASNVPLLFQSFHYWMKVRLEYHACSVQNANDAYEETTSLVGAASSLAEMIRRFDIDKRWPDEDGPYAQSMNELRILGIYGLNDARDENGCYPPAPRFTPLTVVKGRP